MEEKQLRQPEEEQLRPQQSEMRRASAQPDGPHLRHHPQRDEDAEALQQALLESEERDYLAEILAVEAQRTGAGRTDAPREEEPRDDVTTPAEDPVASADPSPDGGSSSFTPLSDLDDDDDDLLELDVLGEQIERSVTLGRGGGGGADDDGESEEEEEDEDPNLHHKLLNFAEHVLLDILRFLDEDSVGSVICSCKRLQHVGLSDALFESICRRIFPVQCPRVAAAVAADRFSLRKFRTWFDMFLERPRVRHNGFYYLRISYYKKPELNMWSEIPPGTILQVIYYRYFSFQRDGSVLYGMLFKPPHQATAELLAEKKDIYRGRYRVERDEVFVSVPTNHSVVEFRFRLSHRGRGKNVKLILDEHYQFSEPNRTGWVNHFDTFEEEFQFYRSWNL